MARALLGKIVDLSPDGPRHRRDDELGDPRAAFDAIGLGAEVDEDHADLAAVVGVDGPGAVQHADAVAQRQPRTWPHLRLVAVGKGDGNPARHQRPGAGSKLQRRVDGGEKIEPGAVLRRIGRQRQVRARAQA